MSRALAWLGGIGALVGIVCCFTPVLPIVLTAIDAAGMIDLLYRDSSLLPFVGVSILMMGAGIWLMRQSS